MKTSPMLVTLTRDDLLSLVREAVTSALAELEPTVQPKLLNRDQCAQALGVHPKTLKRLRDLGLPTVWVCDSPRFELDKVIEWVRTNSSAHLASHGQTVMAKPEASTSLPASLSGVSPIECNQPEVAAPKRRFG